MGRLIFGMMASLDGFVTDDKGRFEWGQIDQEVHRFAQGEEEKVGVSIYGRRMYEMMAVWDTLDADPNVSQAERDFAAVWQRNDKIVVSRTLPEVTTRRTRLVRGLGLDEMARLKAETARDVSVSGPTLAATFLRQGLVDEVSVYIVPVLVGRGLRMFPDLTETLKLERLEQRAFANGTTYLRFAVRR